MSSPKLEEEGVLREWAPMSKLLQQIPMRMRQGMFWEDVKITCVDATIDCIVLGTNCSTVFWYDRASHYVRHLRPEKGASSITCVKVVSTVDFMVACGNNLGTVTIFKVPKSLENQNGIGTNTSEKAERYTVDGLHNTTVTTLEWSINGQKLFSGDSQGVVIFTEMDFAMNLSKAREILNEKFSIVQLSYNQREQTLLVSSKLRCIIWRGQSTNHTITQIGQRERPSLLLLGGTLVCEDTGEVIIYSCRGGLKLWKADLTGDVKYTLLFKEALSKCSRPVKLTKQLDSLVSNKKLPEFGKLYSWRDGLFVSYTNDNIIVFDPLQVRVAATLLNVDEIVGACTTKTELFIVSGQRDLIRLGYTPDLYDSCIGGFGNMATGECVSGLPDVSIEPIYGSPLSTSSNRNSYLSASTANSELSSSEVIIGTDPSILPLVVSLQEGVPELRVEPSRYQQFTSIGQQEFDDIIYSQERPQKHKNRRKSAEMVAPKPKSLGLSFDGITSYVNSVGKFFNDEFSSSVQDGELEPDVVPQNVLPDMRDLKTIVEDVARKEMLLEASLESLMEKCPPNKKLPKSGETNLINESNLLSNELIVYDQTIEKETYKKEKESTEINLIISEENKNTDILLVPDSTSSNCSTLTIEVDTCDTSRKDNQLISDVGLNITEIQDLLKVGDEAVKHESMRLTHPQNNVPYTDIGDESCDQISLPLTTFESNLYSGWRIMNFPDYPSFLSTWKEGVVLCSPKFKVYKTTETSWTLLNYKAQFVFVSNCSNRGVSIYFSIAQFSDNWESKEHWNTLCRDAEHAAVSDDKIWFISSSELFYLSTLENIVHSIPCDVELSKIYFCNSELLAITTSGFVLKFESEKWERVKGIRNCKMLCQGPNNLLWFVNSENGLFVTEFAKESKPTYWQVPITSSKYQEIINICSNEEAIYLVTTGNEPSILFNNAYVTGHRWSVANIKLECTKVSAGGVFEEKGCIWVIDSCNKLIALDSSLIILEEVDAPCNIVCVASAPEALWLLGDNGGVYLRQGISHTYSYYNPVGNKWRKLNMEQLGSHVELVELTCGPDAVWGCDIRGKIVMVVGSPHHIAEDTFVPVWVVVDGKPIQNNTFTKVYVGPETYMVWALDNAGNVYVREGIFPYHPVGTGWVHVPEIKASQLTISSEAVYALNHDGIFKRVGITQSNYIGDGWIFFPVTNLDYITASFEGELWGISSKSKDLMKHKKKTFPLSANITVENDFALL